MMKGMAILPKNRSMVWYHTYRTIWFASFQQLRLKCACGDETTVYGMIVR